MSQVNIKAKNHTNTDNDDFVGIKFRSGVIESDGIISAFFPLGYNIENNASDSAQRELKKQVFSLLSVIKRFNKSNQSDLYGRSEMRDDFPFDAYIKVIRMFLENGYYIERELRYKEDLRGKINWKKTVKNAQPIIQDNGDIAFTKFIVRENKKKDDNLISLVHEWCVYEAFQKLGWLFTDFTPRKPRFDVEKSKVSSIAAIRDALSKTFNDKHKQLFVAMLAMLNYNPTYGKDEFYFGTTHFEHVWECLIDKAYGITNKKDYFPPFQWCFQVSGIPEQRNVLEPDTIMITERSTLVLDAKYYGFINDKRVLPAASDISKQIIYGEYANTKSTNGTDTYNAFLIPYDFHSNPHNLPDSHIDISTEKYLYLGCATSQWEKLSGEKTYHRVASILVDSKWLMSLNNTTADKNELANIIEANIKNAIPND